MRLTLFQAVVLAALVLSLSTRAILADTPGTRDRTQPPAQSPIESPAPSAQAIEQWIDELGSDSYTVREAASDHLVDAGRAAIEAVTAATQKDDLEVTTRSVQILAAMLKSHDIKTADAAADALMKIASVRHAAPAAMAAAGGATDALGDYVQIRQARALSEIGRLGGEIQIGDPSTGSPTDIVISLGSNWHGTGADWKLLHYVPNLEHLTIHGLPITDRDLSNFNGLPQLVELDLFGTKVTPTASADFAKAHPGIRIDRRGAKLGISTINGSCQIEMVQDGSAAKRADLREGDVVVKFQGEAINDFTTLTNRIGACQAGDKVTIEVDRGGQTLDKQVTLGDWK
jgi:hypothetical protein